MTIDHTFPPDHTFPGLDLNATIRSKMAAWKLPSQQILTRAAMPSGLQFIRSAQQRPFAWYLDKALHKSPIMGAIHEISPWGSECTDWPLIRSKGFWEENQVRNEAYGLKEALAEAPAVMERKSDDSLHSTALRSWRRSLAMRRVAGCLWRVRCGPSSNTWRKGCRKV